VSDAWSLLQARKRSSGGAPVVTSIDGATDARTELSATSLENAAAKIANALRDEFDLEQGARVGLLLPLHWQRAAWCAGVWTAGCIVDLDADPTAVDLFVTTIDDAAAVSGQTRRDVAVVSLHPFGLPLSEPLPHGSFDVTLAVRQQPDAYLFEPPSGGLPAMTCAGRTMSQQEVLDVARMRADDWGLGAGGRLLASDGIDLLDGWLAALAVPLVADARVVLAHGVTDLDPLIDQERITARARPS
jgi:uncharacterized protein (TIGR03089 family)